MFKKDPVFISGKNAEIALYRTIFLSATICMSGGRVKRFERALKRPFLKVLYYRAFTQVVKKTLKHCFNGVLTGLKGCLNKNYEIARKCQKHQTRFLGFFKKIGIFARKKGGILI